MSSLKSNLLTSPIWKLSLLALALTSVVLVAACSSEEPTPTPVTPMATATATSVPAETSSDEPPASETPAGDPIKIGTLIDVTGDLAAFGPPIVLATDLAALLINEAGGIDGRPIEMVHRDSGTSPQIATDAASGLVNIDGVEAIVGSLSSGVSLAVAESVTIPGGAVLVSPASTSPAITGLDDNDLVFRTTVSDALQGVIAAQLANQLGHENVATLYINNAYGEGLSTVFSETFESLGGTVSSAVPIEAGQASYATELRHASQGGATVLIAMSYPETAGVYLREAVEGQYFDEFMFVDGTKNQEMFDNLGADSFEGSYGTAPGAPGTPTQETFKDLYSSKLGGDPSSLFISEAFDAAVILALAIAQTGSEDGDDIKEAMREVANAPGEKVGPGDLARAIELASQGIDIDYVGAAGDQDFDENGDVQNTIEVWKIEGGQISSTGIFARPGDSIDIHAEAMMMMEEPTGEPIKIGTLIDTTGDLAAFGPPIVLATDLAALLINEAGGIDGRPIEMVHRDSGTSPQIATDAASGLVNIDGVEAIVGSLSSGVSLAVAESVTIPGGAVLVSPASTSPALTGLDDNDLVFRTTVSDALQGVIAAQLANQLGYENVATLYINNAYGEGLSDIFAETFQSLGGTVSATVPIEGGQASYASELRQASQDGATVLVAMSYAETAGVYLREAVEGQYFNEFMFVDGTKSQDMFDDLGADNFEGDYGTAPGAPGTPTQETFQELYSSKLDGDPSDIFISEAFDAAVILALAIAQSGSENGDDIKDAMREVANAPGEKVGPGDLARALQLISQGQDIDYVGAAGDQDFDENGDVQNTIEVWKIEGGQISSTGIFARPGDSIDIDAENMMMMEEPTGEPIKIGTLIDATGDLAVFGPPIVLATDLAALLINEAGGIDGRPIEMIHRDSGTSPQIATDAASALVNVDGVEAIVGSLSSGVSLAVAESVTIPNGAVLVSPASTSPAISNLNDNDLVFRTTVSDALQGVILANIADQLGYYNVATLYINNAYGEGLSDIFAETFEGLGGTVSATVPIEAGQASYASELRQASQGGATVLVAMSYPETGGVYLREAVEGQYFDEFMFVDGTKNQEMFDTIGPDNFEGSYGTAPGAPGTPTQETFQNLYESKLGGDSSSLFISEAFDAAVILALAIAEAGSEDGDDIKAAMRKVANAPGEKVGPGDLARALQLISQGVDIDYVGAAGEQEFDDKGDVLNTIEVWKLEGGQITSTGIFVSAGEPIELDAGSMMMMKDSGSIHSSEGSFAIGNGSRGLFKVPENLRGADIIVAMETEVLNGMVDFNTNSASIEIDLHSLESDQARRDRYVREQMFPQQPTATVQFADLGNIPNAFFDGGVEHQTTLIGKVNVNGTDADLNFDITARLDNGTNLVILGTSNFVWADFGMTAPSSPFFVVEDEVTVEILLQTTLLN